MKQNEINDFEKINAQLEGLHIEISALSKKSQNDTLNKFKLKFVNQTLKDANIILGNNYKPFNDFEEFNEDDMPTNSDVTLILSQYLSCMEKLRADNIISADHWEGHKLVVSWYWKNTKIETAAPLKIKK